MLGKRETASTNWTTLIKPISIQKKDLRKGFSSFAADSSGRGLICKQGSQDQAEQDGDTFHYFYLFLSIRKCRQDLVTKS